MNRVAITKQKQLAQQQKDLASSLKKLYANPDFVLFFDEYYTKRYVQDIVHKLALYDKDSNEYKECIDTLNAISHFNVFLDTIIANEAMAIQSLKELANLEIGEYDE